MGDLPSAVADNDKELEALLESLETGAPLAPEAPAMQTEEVEEVVEQVDTLADSPPAVDPALTEQLEKSEQRYQTLQGMMRADAKRQQDIIEELKEQVAANKVAEVEAPLDVSAILSEDEQAEFGEAGVKVLEKLAQAIAAKEISKATLEVEHRLDEMRKRVDEAEANASGHTLWDQVEKANPGAKAINESDPGWYDFLDQVDPMSGRANRELGEAAAQAGDVFRLSQLIDAYRNSANMVKPKAAPGVKPNQSQAPTPSQDGNKRTPTATIYTQDDIRDFYQGCALGNLGLSAEQIAAKEADIDAAMEEGRVKL